MSSNAGRGSRHWFDGTGAYIALFLVVTALAVAGYWSLIPHDAPARQPAAAQTPPSVSSIPAPAAAAQTPKAVETPQPDETRRPSMPEAEAAPAQSAVTITLPPSEPADFTPAAPALIVDPLVGETLAVFSMDELRYSETMGDWRTHDGVDLAAEPGTPVCAACAGTVIDVRDDDLMGTTVVLAHDDGYDTVYSNLQSVPTVAVGDYVAAGQIIGSVGKTALSETALAPHLHFSVTKDGEFVDPMEYLG